MQKSPSHIPFIRTVTDFFQAYGLGQPLHSDIMCMRLEDQPDNRLMTMPLYRANFFRVIHFADSQIAFTAGEKKVQVLSNCLCFSYPGKLESWERQNRLYGTVIYFSEAFAQLDPTNPGFDGDFPYFTFDGDIMLPLDKTEALQLTNQADEMIAEMYSDQADKLTLIRKLLQVYLHKIRRIYYQKMGALPADIKANQALFNRFRKATDTYFQQLTAQERSIMPSVSILADELGVSPNYLNGIIKSISGKTASSYLQSKMILEAKSYLVHSDLQVAEIAYRLGFENIPYFNRFFKKHAECTPVEFRTRTAWLPL